MGALFARKKKPNPPASASVTEQDRAILRLKDMQDKLQKYIKRCEIQLANERELAIRLVREQKLDRAKLLLKKKRFLESKIAESHSQLDSLENQVHSIEFSVIETQVALSMKKGNAALQAIHSALSIEDVERIVDDAHAAVEYQKEIDALLGTSWSATDDAKLQSELDALSHEDVAAALPEVPADQLPAADAPVKETLTPVEADQPAGEQQRASPSASPSRTAPKKTRERVAEVAQ